MEEVGEKEGGVYSHSRLWLYESCPEAYKVKYIDKLPIEMPTHISLFLGKAVHEALEWLYYQVKNHEVELDELIEYFHERWSGYMKEINGNVKFHNGDEMSHFNRGVKFLVDYYTKHSPFKQNVVAIERKILFPLDSEGKYKIQGYVDRIDFNKEEGVYEVIDYKTNAYLKSQADLDKDRQLALYHLGLKKEFGDDIKVKLVWHFLSHNLQMSSERTEEELDELKSETLVLIKKIENEKEWKPCGGRYCDWCTFKAENGIDYEDVLKEFSALRELSSS